MADNYSKADTISLETVRRSHRDEEPRVLYCPRHRLPVRGVCLHYQCTQKLICGRCFKELPDELIKAYEDIDDFLSPNRLSVFSEDMSAIEKETQRNMNILKSAMSAIDLGFDKLVEHVNYVKSKTKEQLTKKYDRDHESLHKVTETYSNFRSMMKNLLRQPNEELLGESVDMFVELADLLRIQVKQDKSRFNLYAAEIHKRCMQQVDLSRSPLDKLLNLEEVSIKQSPDYSRSKSVTPIKRNTSLPKIHNSAIHHSRSYNTNPFQVTSSFQPKEVTIVKKIGNGGLKLPDLTKNYELAFETIDTKMKVIEAMAYLPHDDVIVLGGLVRGDQFHKLAFQKISPAPLVMKVITAHSNTINNIIGSQHYLFSCAKDKMVKVWELTSYDCVMVLKHESNVIGMLYDDTTGTLFSYGNFLDIRVWNLPKKKEELPIKVPTNQISQMCFVTSNKEEGKRWIAAGCEQTGKIYLMDLKTGNAVLELEAHAPVSFVNLTHFSGPNLLVGGSLDGLVKVWDLNKVQPPLLSRVMHFSAKTSQFYITSMTAGVNDGLIFLANGTQGIMAGTATESRLQGQIRFDDDGILQHFKLLYLDGKGILLSANKLNGRLVAINASSMRTSRVTNYSQQSPEHGRNHLNYLYEPKYGNAQNRHEFQLKEKTPSHNDSFMSKQSHLKGISSPESFHREQPKINSSPAKKETGKQTDVKAKKKKEEEEEGEQDEEEQAEGEEQGEEEEEEEAEEAQEAEEEEEEGEEEGENEEEGEVNGGEEKEEPKKSKAVKKGKSAKSKPNADAEK